MFDPKNDLFNHWKSELVACIMFLRDVKLKSGSKMRNELDLTVHPELQYRRLAVRGKKVKYLYTWGIKGASSYSLLE